MHYWPPTLRRHRALAQVGRVSEETEEQADALTMLGDVADGVRSLLVRLGSELALAERGQWSRQLRSIVEYRDVAGSRYDDAGR